MVLGAQGSGWWDRSQILLSLLDRLRGLPKPHPALNAHTGGLWGTQGRLGC